MSHFIEKCACGKIIRQCRCFSKDKTVVLIKCDDCKNKEKYQALLHMAYEKNDNA